MVELLCEVRMKVYREYMRATYLCIVRLPFKSTINCSWRSVASSASSSSSSESLPRGSSERGGVLRCVGADRGRDDDAEAIVRDDDDEVPDAEDRGAVAGREDRSRESAW